MIHSAYPPETDMTSTPEPPRNTLEALEYRVQRLEDAVASVQDTHTLEERVVERLSARLSSQLPVTRPEPTSVIVEASRRLLPLALETARSHPHLLDAPAPDAAAASEPETSSWLPYEAYVEAVAMLRMFVDPHYRMSWYARMVPLLLVLAIVTSWYWVPFTSIPVFGMLLDKIVDLILAFFLFKILIREARRYREAFPELSARSRL